MNDNNGFKFKVGDTVRFKFFSPMNNKLIYRKPKGLVLERLLQECPGGIQRHYNLRLFNDGSYDVGNVHRFNEVELEKYEPETPTQEAAESQTSGS